MANTSGLEDWERDIMANCPTDEDGFVCCERCTYGNCLELCPLNQPREEEDRYED